MNTDYELVVNDTGIRYFATIEEAIAYAKRNVVWDEPDDDVAVYAVNRVSGATVRVHTIS